MNRSLAFVAAQAIEDFVAREEWQLAKIGKGLAEADAGDFAQPSELAALLSKYTTLANES